MKKRTIVLLALLGLTGILEACNLMSHGREGGGAASNPPQTTNQTAINTESLPAAQNSNTVSTQTADSYIGETKAFDTALNHAKVDISSLLYSHVRLDGDDGRVIYEVEFYADNKEYDYEIDAVTGNIVGFDADMEYEFIPNNNTQNNANNQQAAQNNNQQTAQNSNQQAEAQQQQAQAQQQQAQAQQQQAQPQQQAQAQPQQVQPQQQAAPQPQPQQQAAPQPTGFSVSLESARQTALDRVPGATADHIRIRQEYDDGRPVYEGKIIYNTMEYDFEIDATTGSIREWDAESIYD